MALVSLASFLALAAAVPVDAPVTSVTVYSDRARITRAARLAVPPGRRVELPLLPGKVAPTSIRVSADGAELTRVDISYVDEERFPAAEARKLLAEIEKLDDQLTRNRAERDAWAQHLQAARNLKPVFPEGEPLRPTPRLNPAAWVAVNGYTRAWAEKAQAKVRDLDVQERTLRRKRDQLGEQARLMGGAARRSGHRVVATLSGSGQAKLNLSYEVGGARWYPAYDIQLRPDAGQVDVLFSGQVSQETGEDWSDAALTLSTAVPATSTRLPKLYTWKIGERERFIPTPHPVSEPIHPAPRAEPPRPSPSPGGAWKGEPPSAAERGEEQSLRHQLMARANVPPAGGQPTFQPATGRDTAERNARSQLEQSGEFAKRPDHQNGYQDDDGTPDATEAMDEEVTLLEKEKDGKKVADKSELTRRQIARDMIVATPRPDAASEVRVITRMPGYAPARKRSMSWGPSSPPIPEPTENVGLMPPAGWRAPVYDRALPASLAGGYDLTYASLATETIKSGAGARRVALFAKTWPVTAERKVFPALAGEAFLVAEIKNPSGQALPGGRANLFVGADPAGTAMLGVVAPGEAFTLPLGLDRAIKPVRNVKVSTVERGVINKDEINEYSVTTEIANPYRVPVAMRLFDQVPVTDDKDVEIKLVRSEPAAQLDQNKGELAWKVTVPPSGKSTVTFVYTLKRPKGYRLHQ
jgi:hypothetical protein